MSKAKTIPGLFEMTLWLIFLTTKEACSNKFAKKLIDTVIKEPRTDWKNYMVETIKKQDNVQTIADKIVQKNFDTLHKDYTNGKLNMEKKLTVELSKEFDDYQPFQEYGVYILIGYGKLI